jgi:hypothetical protein
MTRAKSATNPAQQLARRRSLALAGGVPRIANANAAEMTPRSASFPPERRSARG